MTALEELEVSHCERLSDLLGIAGTGVVKTRVSIKTLHQGQPWSYHNCAELIPTMWCDVVDVVIDCVSLFLDLQVLSIRACPFVTPEGLLSSVLAVPFLQHLDYYTGTPFPSRLPVGSPPRIRISSGDNQLPHYRRLRRSTRPVVVLWLWDVVGCRYESGLQPPGHHSRIKVLHNLVSIPFAMYYVIYVCSSFSITKLIY